MSKEEKKGSEKMRPENESTSDSSASPELDLQKEVDELKIKQESLLRALAEAENIKNRTIKDKDNAVKYSLSGIVKELTLVLDNFTLSMQNVKQEDIEHKAFKSFYDAINITLNDFMKMLEKNGVRKIYPKDEVFNPNEHDAVSQIKVDGIEKNIVIQVLSTGYAIEDRVIKPAMVVVSAE